MLALSALSLLLLAAMPFRKLLASALTLLVVVASAAAASKPNILFIAVDDLKPALGCYGDPHAKTPHIDKLAARGIAFERAYCMQAVCSPSRNSLLTGLRQETLGIYDLSTFFRKRAPDVKTLPQWFKEQGYASHSLGKIYHTGHGNQDDAASWSVASFEPRGKMYANPESGVSNEQKAAAEARPDRRPRGAAWEKADVEDHEYSDGKIAAEAIARLRGFREKGGPFFLAVGFHKPHLPFCAPAKYWDLYDAAKLPMPEQTVPPKGAPAFAPQFGGELRQYRGIPKSGPLPPEMQRTLIHGYYAATSFVDAQIGRVLDELDRLDLAKNTIVVLWGDHGWHLGDHGMWCKHTNYEQATRSALIFAAPGKAGGLKTRSLAEFIDIYPTLCELAGLPKPGHLEGRSLLPVFTDPNAAVHQAAHQVYPRSTPETGPLFGHAVRTDRWRYIEWRKADGSAVARELYDMEKDPGETANAAGNPEHAAVLKEHADLLEARLRRPPPEGLKLIDLKRGSAAAPAPAPGATRRPNIIVVLADDQGWGDLSLHGNPNLRTPHIDSLGRDGAVLDRFYVSAVCAPTRAEFLTGRYHPRTGVRGVSTGAERLDLGERTIAEVFKQSGYATALFGKWHNGSQWPYHPKARGFDEFYGFTSGHWGEYFDPPLERNGRLVRGKGFIVDDFTDQLLAFIDAKKAQPFFSFLALNTPHSPFAVPQKYWDRFEDKPITLRGPLGEKEDLAVTRCTLAMCENIDDNVGRILAKLDELKLREDTIVLYFSDNGPNSDRWNGGMKGRKGSVDEGGVRSPCLMRWPGKIPRGTKVPGIAAAIDLLPTLAAMSGIALAPVRPIDGRDISPQILGTGRAGGSGDERMIFSHQAGRVSVRTQRHRLDERGALFDMEKDPGQTRDIATEQPSLADELRAAAAQWRAEVLPEGKDDRPFPVGFREFPNTFLPARDGAPQGGVQRSAPAPNCSYFVNWRAREDAITWDIDVREAGEYEVTLHYTCPEADAGSTIELAFGDSTLTGKVQPGWDPPLYANQDTIPRPKAESKMKEFRPLAMGSMKLEKGRGHLTLRALEIPGKSVMDLRLIELRLKPIELRSKL